MPATVPIGRQDSVVRWLRDHEYVTDAEVREAEAARAADPNRPELLDHLTAAGAVAREHVHRALAEVFRGVPVRELPDHGHASTAGDLLAPETARRLGVLPLSPMGAASFEVAVCDPFDLAVIAELQEHFGTDVQPNLVLADAHAIYAGIAAAAAVGEEPEPEPVDLGALTLRAATEAGPRFSHGDAAMDRQVRESAVSQLTDQILGDAVRLKASDIHIEFFPGFGWVRMRVDGVLREWGRLPGELEQDLVGHIKARSRMDSVNRLIPQDGRLCMAGHPRRAGGRTVDFRVSTVPTVSGEKAVLRVLDANATALSLADLGLTGSSLEVLRRAVRQSWGMVLITGPTGSGKSTTLYSILAALARPEVNVVSIEDPVERRIPMVTQISIRRTDDERTSLSYASVLRAVLRQDPNVVMIGEIRDTETAQTATRAAMTGHLLLSTLHTNDAPSTVSRLVDMGVEPYNVAGTVRLVVAQRLVRRICSGCRRPEAVEPELLGHGDGTPDWGSTCYRGAGCDACGGTGYRGRVGVFEILEVDDTIRRLIAQRRSDQEIAAAARANGMQPLRDAGLARVQAGETTLEEILKET